MESLDPVAPETFILLKNSFDFYFYHVFIWFGVNVHNFVEYQKSELIELTTASKPTTEPNGYIEELFATFTGRSNKMELEKTKWRKLKLYAQAAPSRRIAQKKYPILKRVINEVGASLRSRKLAPELEDLKTRRPRRLSLAPFAKCFMEASEALNLYSSRTMQGVAARFVATETLTFLVNVIKSQKERLINILSPHGTQWKEEVPLFVARVENAVKEFKKYMYRNVPTLLVHLGDPHNRDSIISHIHNTNWNLKQLTTEPNGYVCELIGIFTRIENVLSSFPTLPKFIHNRLNREAIIYVAEQLVEAYAECKKCTEEGRALMSLDISVLKKSDPISKYYHSWEYCDSFITAYYLCQQDLLQWIAQHPEYPLKVHKSFLRCGRASENLYMPWDRQNFEKQIERIYEESKRKQEEKSNENN
eukprot:137736_1